MSVSRRSFLAATAAVPLAGAPAWQFFTPEEATVVEALTAQIVPTDQDAGAREARVVAYIDRQLAGPLSRFAPRYREGIPAFQAACRERTGQEFAALPFAAQTEFLQAIDSGGVPRLGGFFQMVIDHTMQGFYGSPEHGGNKGGASWRMLGIASVMHGGHA